MSQVDSPFSAWLFEDAQTMLRMLGHGAATIPKGTLKPKAQFSFGYLVIGAGVFFLRVPFCRGSRKENRQVGGSLTPTHIMCTMDNLG